MSKFPKISIITPSYNQGQFIEETICSVLDQGYPNLEYIIIDGGSTDNSVEVIKKYEQYLAYWVSEKDKGQSDAINKGIRRATGEIVNWLNSDDYYMPGALYHIGSVFANESVAAYCGRSRIFSETTEQFSLGTDVYFHNLQKTIGWARIDQPETFFRHSVWQNIGYLNEGLHYIMDKEWWMRYLVNYGLNNIYKDDQVLVNFRIHQDSKTGSQKEKFEKETIDFYYSLCLKNNMARQAGLLKLKFNAEPISNIGNYENKDLLLEVVNYFLFYLFCLQYARSDFELVKEIKPFVDASLLATEDKKRFKNLLLKAKFLPLPLKRLYNNLKKP